jgi:hypothetical protein
MKPKVYLETSIPGFYCEARPEPNAVARREWTRQWWDHDAALCERYLLVTSAAVLDELADGEYPRISASPSSPGIRLL